MLTMLSTLSRFIKHRLKRNERIRLSNVNCFIPALAYARPIALRAGQGDAGMGLGGVAFEPSGTLHDRVKMLGMGPLGLQGLAGGELASSRIGRGIIGCLHGGRFVAHDIMRSVYNVAHAATAQRVHHLYRRGILIGGKLRGRPVCFLGRGR